MPLEAEVAAEPGCGLVFEDFMTGEDRHEVLTERDAVIRNFKGEVVFEQRGVLFPKSWSDMSVNIVASKYFHGRLGTPEREYSLEQLIDRVVNQIGDWGYAGGYFASTDDRDAFGQNLDLLLRHQYVAFNSPVWFNLGCWRISPDSKGKNWHWNSSTNEIEFSQVGYTRPQCSACFINSVEDSMESILELAKTEGMLFKWGSGTGTNLSTLRSANEALSSGGTASGPLSFMRGFDAFAGVIKSGGTCLAPHQPVFTNGGIKTIKELADSGKDFVTLSLDKSAGRVKAKNGRAWKSGLKQVVALVTDKGEFHLSFDHPVLLSDGRYVKVSELKSGMSISSFSTYMTGAGYVRVGLQDGRKGKDTFHRLIARDVLGVDVDTYSIHHRDGNKLNNDLSNLEPMTQADHAALHGKESAAAGTHVFQTRSFIHSGSENGMHSDSEFWADEQKSLAYRQMKSQELLDRGDAAEIQKLAAQQKMINTGYRLINSGLDISSFENHVAARKAEGKRIASITGLRDKFDTQFGGYENYYRELRDNNHRVHSVDVIGNMDVYDIEVDCPTPDDKTPNSSHNFAILPIGSEGFSGKGIFVSNTRRAAKMVILNGNHPDVEEFILCKGKEEAKAHALIREGYDGTSGPESEAYMSIAFQNANNSVRVDDDFMYTAINGPDGLNYDLISVRTGEVVKRVNARKILTMIAEQTWACGDPGMQFDTTINKWHTCPESGRINASNPCCFVGETEVDTEDDRLRIDRLEQMDREGQSLPRVLAWDLKGNQPALKQIEHVWIAGRTSTLVEVNTQRGISITCTPEHLFLTIDGTYVEAQDLTPGTRLQHQRATVNDQVVSVEHITLDEPVNVYDMQVADTHNFAITSGDSVHSIVVSNSEYMFLDDTACNLASFNLLKFYRDGRFDTDLFSKAVRVLTVAMDIIVDGAGYPTERIARNSHDYRPLGLGYANLGALLMAMGLAYDSDEGRTIAAQITSLLGGCAYRSSAEMARFCPMIPSADPDLVAYSYPRGVFPGYTKNRLSFLEVMRSHRQAALDLFYKSKPTSLAVAAQSVWSEVESLGVQNGFRNSQVTVLAPTGTIGFMMDCDTTGIEPMLGLVTFKKMVGGGFSQLTYPVVKTGLIALGYSPDIIESILEHIKSTGTVVGSKLAAAHYPVFDGAFAPAGGGRSISYLGHIQMMEVTQPFLSGAISKTVNLPENSTVEDVFEAYVESWKRGLKAVAIYRDGSKKNQVLVTSKDEKAADKVIASIDELVRHFSVAQIEDALSKIHNGQARIQLESGDPVSVQTDVCTVTQNLDAPPAAVRHKLGDTRNSVTHKFSIANHEGYLTVGLYPNGSVGEIFITMAKEGSTLSGVMDAFATAVSIGLQHGVPLTLLCDKFAHTRFEPSGWTHNQDIGFAKSIMDYIFRWMKMRYVDQPIVTAANEVPPAVVQEIKAAAVAAIATGRIESSKPETVADAMAQVLDLSDSPSCSNCGAIMTRSGSCYRCMNCGGTSGCS